MPKPKLLIANDIDGHPQVLTASAVPEPKRQSCDDGVYFEIIGNRHRGEVVPPPQFPTTCPHCGAVRTANGTSRYDGPTYACGGSYSLKDQIQNHTDYYWGRCPKGKKS